MSQYVGMQSARESADGRSGLADFRSDTVTLPSDAMKQAALVCPLGDDVYEEDPTVKALEEKAAVLLDKPAALFFPTATQSNLAGVLSHCQRGEEVLVGDQYHIFRDEARGVSVLGGVTMEPIATDINGCMNIDSMSAAIKPDDPHVPISRLLCLENTVSGCVQNQRELDTIADRAHQANLAVHLDGARLFNAAVALNCPVSQLVAVVDSISLCLSKGLGAPAGSLLVGSADFIKTARRNRKMLGGGMRQAGFLAACGLFALENNIDRLADDHAIARQLANELAAIDGLDVALDRVQTNMLFVRSRTDNQQRLCEFLSRNDVLIGGQSPFSRMVVHMDISENAAARTVDMFKRFFQNN